MPRFDKSEAIGRAGVHEVGLAISRMKWIFREQAISDTGIDGLIETCDQDGNATGKMAGCQIKSGPRYFKEETATTFIYRGDADHLAYWLGYSLPVIIVLCKETGECLWQVINEKTVIRTGKEWKVEIPKSQILGEAAKTALQTVADTGWIERTRTFTTSTKFFRRTEANPLFDYEQTLYGRVNSLSELDQFLQAEKHVIAVLTGRGGIGKSKLVRQWVSQISGWTVVFKKETVGVSETSEHELSCDRCLVIVDDAHRHLDIDALLQLVRDLRRGGKNIKVLLSCRPIGLQRIDAALSRSFDPTDVVRLKELRKLDDKDVRALAEEVLGPQCSSLAPYLVSVSRDTPLVTVIGGRLLRQNLTSFRDLPNAEDFRRAVFDKFLDDFDTLVKRGPRNVRPLLHLVSALQPLALRNESVVRKCASFLKWEDFEVGQSVDEVESSGLLIRSGGKYRLAPDMLADFLLEQAALNRDGKSNGYADAIYRAFGDDYLSNLLQNLAELDFRTLEKGEPSLLSNIWTDLRSKFENADSSVRVQILNGIQSAAYYQPGSALELVRLAMQPQAIMSEPCADPDRLFQNSRENVLDKIPGLLQAISYHADYLDEAVLRLWELAKADSRRPNSYADHAFRVLKRIAAYSRYKPVEFNVRVAKIFRNISAKESFLKGKRTPLDIVDELLEREGEEQESAGNQIILTRFGFNYKAIEPARTLSLEIVEECLNSNDVRKECAAFRSLSKLIHGFLAAHPLGDEELRWHRE